MPTPSRSPASTLKDLKDASGDDAPNHDLDLEANFENIKLSADDEDDTKATQESPTSPSGIGRFGRARSLVDGFVTSLRSIPRSMTQSQAYDRRSSSSYYSKRTGQTGSASVYSSDSNYKYPEQGLPYSMPILLAPPFAGIPPTITGSELSKPASQVSFVSQVGEFLEGIKSLPWISPRVSVDYVPGETSRSRDARSTSTSWYSIQAPATPSEIIAPWNYVPEPWFPPTQLPPTQEEPEPDEDEGQEGQAEGEDNNEDKPFDKKLASAQEELQRRTRELNDLRQVVEHQKKTIGVLEGQITEVGRKSAGSPVEVYRRRSSTRRSLHYRTRDSVKTVTSMRKGSASRPPSSFFDG